MVSMKQRAVGQSAVSTGLRRRSNQVLMGCAIVGMACMGSLVSPMSSRADTTAPAPPVTAPDTAAEPVPPPALPLPPAPPRSTTPPSAPAETIIQPKPQKPNLGQSLLKGLLVILKELTQS